MKRTSSCPSKGNKKSATSSLQLALESRLLFDGALTETANDIVHNTAVQKNTPTDTDIKSHSTFDFVPLELDKDALEHKVSSEKSVLSERVVEAVGAEVPRPRTLIVIDPRSDVGQTLIAKPPSGCQLLVLDNTRNGFQQVSNALGGWHEVENLHVVPWIKNGEQWLGNVSFGAITTASVSNTLADWGDGLADNANVTFYGEHIASESTVLSQVDVMTGAQSSWTRDIKIADQSTDTAGYAVVERSTTPTTTSVVFIDTSVSNPAAIVAVTDLSAEIVYLYAAQDGFGQIADYLVGRTDIDNIQIVSHGEDGKLFLGNAVVSKENLISYSNQLAQIGQSLTANGDILLYGCNVAETWIGDQFVHDISMLTGADVAASADTTGAVVLGGDWVLEEVAGAIETKIKVAKGIAYAGVSEII
jgi:hypothetical protein